ncbi:PREDICTED: signaling lymphocytic activation molecule [Cyprinodon variegatus]|uniref:signaling lymphocytic activation molecule n=1 Tax=Cyprinodon variegatus TaxID=28743 RepID=UPI0007427216|nr:PREDICTED: signaling lymphocytic activation molecule [Cyprinodon variegatus]
MPSVETPPGVFRISIRGFLVFFTLSVCLVAGQTPKYLLQGQTVSFVTDIREPPNEILWKHDGNKVVEFDGSEQKAFGSYEHRVTLDWHSADLTISNLRYEDSGLYELETYINNKLDRKQYQLEVIDKVAKPEISCKIINATSPDKSGSKATLTCSSKSHDPQSLLTFQWSSATNSHHVPEIIISLGDVNDDHIYNCTVSNPLSKESAVFQAKDCYPASCSPDRSIYLNLPILIGRWKCPSYATPRSSDY